MKGKPISRISRRGLILSPTLFRFLKGVSRLFRRGLFWPHRFSWDEKWQLGENLSWAKGGGPKTPHRWRIVQSFNSERINPMCRTKLLPRYLEMCPYRCCSKNKNTSSIESEAVSFIFERVYKYKQFLYAPMHTFKDMKSEITEPLSTTEMHVSKWAALCSASCTCWTGEGDHLLPHPELASPFVALCRWQAEGGSVGFSSSHDLNP